VDAYADGMADGDWTIELGELDVKMGVRILEQSAERVVATMPVEGNRQSFGLLHGGASGLVTGVATAIRLGRTITSHEVVVTDEDGNRLCTARITNLIVDARQG
jgi:1,4-dihydroxy-2-naphthoyl-CoA hydrolase